MTNLFEQTHLDFISDVLAPMSEYPTHIVAMANKICDANPDMDRKKFLDRAVSAWEGAQLDRLQSEHDDYEMSTKIWSAM